MGVILILRLNLKYFLFRVLKCYINLSSGRTFSFTIFPGLSSCKLANSLRGSCTYNYLKTNILPKNNVRVASARSGVLSDLTYLLYYSSCSRHIFDGNYVLELRFPQNGFEPMAKCSKSYLLLYKIPSPSRESQHNITIKSTQELYKK